MAMTDSGFRTIPAERSPVGPGPLDAPLVWPDRPDTLAATLAVVAEIGERFILSVGDAARGSMPADGLPADGLTADGLPADGLTDADLSRGIADRGRDVGTDEDRVATVLYLHSYAYRVAAPMLAAWVLHGRVPDVSAANLSLRFNAIGRPQDVTMRAPRVYALPGDSMTDAEVVPVADLAGAAIEVLLTRHLLPLMTRLRPFGKLGLPVAKGSVASQIGAALSFIDAQSAAPWQTVSRIALEFLERTTAEIAGQGVSGDMQLQQAGEREGVIFRRGTCCLIYRVPDKGYCGGCPLRTRDELLETWSARLLARPTTGLVTSRGRVPPAD